jgi:hypothetical protein
MWRRPSFIKQAQNRRRITGGNCASNRRKAGEKEEGELVGHCPSDSALKPPVRADDSSSVTGA